MSARVSHLLLLLLAGCSTIPKRGDIRIPNLTFPMHAFTLPSGMKVIFQEDHSSPFAAVVSFVDAGAVTDPPGKSGLAHFVEHLAFRSRRADGPTAQLELEQLGAARVNARTSWDHVVFHQVVPKSALPAVLALEGRRLLDPLLGVGGEGFEIEREVVRNELRLRAEMPLSGVELGLLLQALFPAAHPYAKSPGGDDATIASFTLEDARAFAKRTYRPERITVLVAGDFDPKATERLLLASLPPDAIGDPKHPVTRAPGAVRSEPRDPPAVPPARTMRLEVPAANLAWSEICIGWTLPAANGATADLESALLEVGLRTVVQEELGPADGLVGLATAMEGGALGRFLLLRLQVKRGVPLEPLAKRVLAKVYRVRGFFDGSVYNDAVRIALSATAIDSERLLSRAMRVAEVAHTTGNADLYGSLREVADKGWGQSYDLAYSWLVKDRARVLLIEPSTRIAAEPRPREAVHLDATAANELAGGAPPKDLLREVLAFRDAGFELRELTLENGLEVRLAARPGTVTARAALIFFGGNADDRRPGESLLERATGARSRFNEGSWSQFGGYGVSFGLEDAEVWYAAVPAGNLPNLLEILSESVRSRKISSHVFDDVKERWPAELEATQRLPLERAERSFLRLLFGAHPFAAVPEAADIARLERDDVVARLERTYRPANALLIVSGDFSLPAAESAVRSAFAGWEGAPGPRSPAPPLPSRSESGPRFVLTPLEGAAQFGLTLGCVLVAGEMENRAAVEIAAQVVERGLDRQLRHQLGATYAVTTVPRAFRGGGAKLVSSIWIDAARPTESLAKVADAWRAWGTGGSTAAEIEASRWAIIRERAPLAYDHATLIDALAQEALLGERATGAATTLRSIAAVDKGAVDRVLEQCHQGLAISIVGSEATLAPAIPPSWTRARD